MTQNPYEPPHDAAASHPVPFGATFYDVSYAYESQWGTARALISLFWLIGISHAIMLTIEFLNTTLGLADETWTQFGDNLYAPVWIMYTTTALVATVGYLIAIFVYGSWIRRANRNARALGAEGMRFTPGWAFGWFFVPIGNLVHPYRAVRELYQTSSPQAGAMDWDRCPARIVGIWWTMWLVSNFASNIESRLFRGENRSDSWAAYESWVGITTGIFWVVTCYLAAKVVVCITQRQEAKRMGLATGQGKGLGSI